MMGSAAFSHDDDDPERSTREALAGNGGAAAYAATMDAQVRTQSDHLSNAAPFDDDDCPSDMRTNGIRSLVAQSDRHGRCTKAASDCLEKMTGLAREFNHRTVGVAHLIIAMTLVPSAARQFRLRHIDVEHAFRQAMLALIDMQRVAPGEAIAELSSDELLAVLKLADEIAKNRDNQPVSVDDLLTALNNLPPNTPAAQPLRGTAEPPLDLKSELETFVSNVGQTIREMIHQTPAPVVDPQLGRDIADLRALIQQRDAAMERLILSQFSELRIRFAEERQATPAPAGDAVTHVPTEADQPGWLRNVFGSSRP